MVIRCRMMGLSIGRRMVSPPLGEGLETDFSKRVATGIKLKSRYKADGARANQRRERINGCLVRLPARRCKIEIWLGQGHGRGQQGQIRCCSELVLRVEFSNVAVNLDL